jgi:hypothetical protein
MIIQGVTLTGTRVVDASFITQNLAIWVDANNATSYSGTGTTVTDLSGNNRTQNLSSASAYAMLTGIKCFDFSGTYLMRGASAVPTLPTGGFTYIAWARMISSSATWRTLFRTSPNDHPLLIELGSNRLGMYDNTSNAFYSAGYDVSALANVWAQWAVTGDSSGQTFYINGQQVGTVSGQTASGNSHDYTGGVGAPNGQPFGYVANMELYTSILTQEQIQQNYYNQLPTFTLPNITTSNLVLWYDPSFATSYPGSGTIITNLANTSLPGTLSNVTYTNPYFSYNGSSSQVTIADNALLEPGSGDWTIEVWVNQTIATGSQVILGKFDPGGLSADVSYAVRVIGGNVRADFGNGTTAMNTANYALPANTWTQLVYVFNNVANNNVITYVNGVQQATTTHSFASILNTTANLYLGSYNNGEYNQWFNGRIGVTRLYSAALSTADVLQNYNADKGKYGL